MESNHAPTFRVMRERLRQPKPAQFAAPNSTKKLQRSNSGHTAPPEYFEARAHELQVPVLVVWGKYDRFIRVELAHEIAEKLPNAKLEVIDKSGHYVHMDRPQKLVQVVTEFLHEAA